MSMKISIAALAALLLAGPVRAEDAVPAPTAKESVMTFFRHLKESLAQSAVRGERKHNRVGSVAAVRGADQSSSPLGDPNEPVLKGDARSKKDKIAMSEDAEFSKAVDLVLAGKTDDGVKALESFKAKHPKSHSLAKVQEAIDEAKGISAAPSQTPAAPAADAVKADASAVPSAK
jgi:hypothetical protein